MKVTIAVLHLSLRSLNIHLHAPSGKFLSRSMQHVLVANKKRLIQGCKYAVAHSRPKTWSARTFFCLLHFRHMNVAWQSLYASATKNCCALLTLASFIPLCTFLVTTLCKFYRCSKSMHNIAFCMHCESRIPGPIVTQL